MFTSIKIWINQPHNTRIVWHGLLYGLILFAFGLRVYGLASVPLMLDEINTIRRHVPDSLIEIFTEYHSNNHPMASAMAHFFSPNADNLFLMRWPFILLSIITLPFIYRLAAGLFDRRVGLLTVTLVSIAPVYIGYSVVVRGYGGLISLTAIAMYFLWKILRDNRWYDWVGLASVGVMIPFFHLFGALAMGMMLGLIGVWLMWEIWYHQKTSYKRLLVKLCGVAGLLAMVYLFMIYARTGSVLSEGGYPGEFEVWRNGLAWPEDYEPLTIWLGLMAPISIYGIGAYIYLIFNLIGFVFLWNQRRALAVAAIIWLLTPFILILVAMIILGSGFYVYARFLLYLLPVYLLLVALGMSVFFDKLSDTAGRPSRQLTARVVKWGTIVGLCVLMAISFDWYLVRATHTNWIDLARVLSANMQSEDIVICEDYLRDLDVPDRAKPYCVWMLDFYTELEENTPRLQGSTDLVANYEYIHSQRNKMSSPGGVWLVVWQKIVFNVGHLATDEKPIVKSVPASLFYPYPTRQYGSAVLVYINSEKTLLENMNRAVHLLSKIDESSATKARYYRSLSEMEAVQGHRERAVEFFENSWAMLEQTGGVYPGLYLQETQQIIDRVPNYQPFSEMAYRSNYKVGSSLCLEAFEISPILLSSDKAATIFLYWQTLNFVEGNYGFFFEFIDKRGQTHYRLEFESLDRIYPTPWWWKGQKLVQQRQFVIPSEIVAQDYVMNLGIYDRSLSGEENIIPLFTILHQSDSNGVSRWQVEPVSSFEFPTCE